MEQQEELFLELEKQLLNDDKGVLRQELEDYLEEWRLKVKRHMDKGLPVDEFNQFQQVETALSRAKDVLQKTWSAFHPEGLK
ncbi:MAG: EscE/YscE/SsaE family type III secretion system needle protein co-chaperone [Thermodesulforhabdaceae bacterium]